MSVDGSTVYRVLAEAGRTFWATGYIKKEDSLFQSELFLDGFHGSRRKIQCRASVHRQDRLLAVQENLEVRDLSGSWSGRLRRRLTCLTIWIL
jgi:hypothetical protein